MRRYIAVFMLALLALGSMGSVTTNASPVTQPPQPWVVGADGSSQLQVSERYAFEKPSWSPAGDRFAVGTYDGSLVLEADGGGERQIAWALQPDWSPIRDDLLLVVASPEGSDTGIYTFDLDTNEFEPVLMGVTAAYPTWSPDGTRVAFLDNPDGAQYAHLFVVDVDGSDLQQLSSIDALYIEPVWSPDSSQLAFNSWDSGLWVVDADGTEERRLDVPTDRFAATDPDWSPDGTKIATDGGWVFDVASGHGESLTNGGNDPDWSPTGAEIAYSAGTAPRIRVVASDGSTWREVSSAEDDSSTRFVDEDPSWSPDGSLIAFGREKTSGYPPPDHTSIRYARASDSFRGTINSARSWCVRGRVVVVKKKRPGPDRFKGRDASNRRGKWRIAEPGARGRFYAVIARKTRSNGETCERIRSATIRVRG